MEIWIQWDNAPEEICEVAERKLLSKMESTDFLFGSGCKRSYFNDKNRIHGRIILNVRQDSMLYDQRRYRKEEQLIILVIYFVRDS